MISIKPPRKCQFRNGNVSDAQALYAMEAQVTGENRGSLADLTAFFASEIGNAALCYWQGITRPLVGYLLYDCFHDHQEIILRDLLVRPSYRGNGIGHAFLSQIMHFCSAEGYHAIARVPEQNLPAQLLLRHAGWHCDRIVQNLFGKGQHAYRFRFPGPHDTRDNQGGKRRQQP